MINFLFVYFPIPDAFLSTFREFRARVFQYQRRRRRCGRTKGRRRRFRRFDWRLHRLYAGYFRRLTSGYVRRQHARHIRLQFTRFICRPHFRFAHFRHGRLIRQLSIHDLRQKSHRFFSRQLPSRSRPLLFFVRVSPFWQNARQNAAHQQPDNNSSRFPYHQNPPFLPDTAGDSVHVHTQNPFRFLCWSKKDTSESRSTLLSIYILFIIK